MEISQEHSEQVLKRSIYFHLLSRYLITKIK
jgi:hypothetical protein